MDRLHIINLKTQKTRTKDMKFRSVSLFAVPFLVLTSFSPILAATKMQTAKTFEHQSHSKKVLFAGFFDDLGDAIEDAVEEEVNGIFDSKKSPAEKPQRDDIDIQEQRQREVQTRENESIELKQLSNINPVPTKVKTGSAANNLNLFCNMDYAKEAAEATSQSEIQSITSEARDNNCLSTTEVGSELTYQYLGKEEYGIVLVGQNNNGQPYVDITQAKNIQTEEQLSTSSENETTASNESSRNNYDPIDVGQFANITSASPDLNVSYSTRDAEMFCMDYLERRQTVRGNFKQQMSIRNEAIQNDCGIRHYAGSPFSYKQIGDKEDNRYLIVTNLEGKDYYAITTANWVVAEAPEYVPKSGQHSMAELKQLLDRKEGETYEEWYKRYRRVTYSERITNEELRAYKLTLSPRDIQAQRVLIAKENDERGDIINEGIKVILEDALTPSQQTGETTICRGPRNYDGSYTKYECPVR
ncbi:MAG: hypothetical protein ACFCAD_00980 [Pleurocapsa sp.]